MVKLNRKSAGAFRGEVALKRFKGLMKKNEGKLSFAGHGGRVSGQEGSEPKRRK
jgi:hypothetical protein